ncbi:hypothetical protein KW782_03770 [Candidatus Parcubacteria bacterium]|nr:hypothetical protein [Candidatus Parcubacteria bacterium]
METVQRGVEQKFSSPEEELVYLRQQVAERERELVARGAEIKKDDIVSDKVRDYSYLPTKEVLYSHYQMAKSVVEELALALSPEEHDIKISELAQTLKEKGLKNTLDIVDGLNDPHVEDDFHRFLVQYVKKGLQLPDLKPKSELFQELTMTLYELSLSDGKPDEKERQLKELLSTMEQFYAGMASIDDKNDPGRYFTIEIANPNHSEEFIIYVSVPDTKKGLFEKQFLSLFPGAKLREMPDDYNVFNEAGVTVGSIAEMKNHPIFPLKMYDEFDYDPLNVILNTFSKISKDGEGAAIQLVFRPTSYNYAKDYTDTIKQISQGVPVKKALPKTHGQQFAAAFKDVLFGSKKKEELPKITDAAGQAAIEHIKKKMASPMAEVNIRIIASGRSEPEATSILSDIESAFNQFENPGQNKLMFTRVSGKGLQRFTKDFSFRAFSEYSIFQV